MITIQLFSELQLMKAKTKYTLARYDYKAFKYLFAHQFT